MRRSMKTVLKKQGPFASGEGEVGLSKAGIGMRRQTKRGRISVPLPQVRSLLMVS